MATTIGLITVLGLGILSWFLSMVSGTFLNEDWAISKSYSLDEAFQWWAGSLVSVLLVVLTAWCVGRFA